jgi:hypothetical protein
MQSHMIRRTAARAFPDEHTLQPYRSIPDSQQ